MGGALHVHSTAEGSLVSTVSRDVAACWTGRKSVYGTGTPPCSLLLHSHAGNALIGPLPPSWHTLLDEVDVVVHSNTGLRGRVPEEWLERVKAAGWFERGRMLDVTGCSGLDAFTYVDSADYKALRVC